MSLVAFFVLAAIILVAALLVVLSTNPVNSAVSLIVALFGVAALFALAGNGFLAVVQVLIYAGAVVTLFIFVVMLLNLRDDELAESGLTFQKIAGVLAAALLFVNITSVSALTAPPAAGAVPTEGDPLQLLARHVFGRYGLAFELTSVLLLVALIGVITLARREKAE